MDDEREVRGLLARIADSAAPRSSVDIERARLAGLRRLRLRRLGPPAVSVGAIAAVAGLVAGGVVPIGPGSGPPSTAQLTVRLPRAEIRVLTNSDGMPRAAAEINNAYQLLITRCMKSKGLKYYPLYLPVADFRGYPDLAGVPQASIGLAARESDGYGFYSRRIWARKHRAGGGTREDKYAASAGKKYELALNGPAKDRVRFTMPGGESGSVPAGGCGGWAQRRLYGSVVNYVVAGTGLSDMQAVLLDSVTSDPAFTAVVGRWSSCMAGRGYQYSTPENLWNGLADRIDSKPTPALRDLEIRTAVADYRCSKSVALLATVRALQAWHARNYSKAYAGGLARLTRVEARALKVARALHVHVPGQR